MSAVALDDPPANNVTTEPSILWEIRPVPGYESLVIEARRTLIIASVPSAIGEAYVRFRRTRLYRGVTASAAIGYSLSLISCVITLESGSKDALSAVSSL